MITLMITITIVIIITMVIAITTIIIMNTLNLPLKTLSMSVLCILKKNQINLVNVLNVA